MHIYWYQLFYCIKYLKQVNLQISAMTYYYTLLQKKQTFITENHFVTNISSFASYGKFQNLNGSFSGGNRITQIPLKMAFFHPSIFNLFYYMFLPSGTYSRTYRMYPEMSIFSSDFISIYTWHKVFFHYVCLLCFFPVSP